VKLVVDVPERTLGGKHLGATEIAFSFPPNIDDEEDFFVPMMELFGCWEMEPRIFERDGRFKWRASFSYVPAPGVHTGERELAIVIFSEDHVSFTPYTTGGGKRWHAGRGTQSHLLEILFELEQALNAKVE